MAATGVGVITGYLVTRPSPHHSVELQQQTEQLAEIQRQLTLLQRTSQAEGMPERSAQPTPTAASIEQMVRRAVGERTPEEPSPKPKEPSTANLEAYRQADRLFTEAMGSKRWTDRDNAEMHRLVRDMTGDQRFGLTKRFIVAANGQLRVETTDAPFW